MRDRKWDKVSRADRARRRQTRRRALIAAKWAVVLIGAASFAAYLARLSGGAFARADTLFVFADVVILYWLLEKAAVWTGDAVREILRAKTRERVRARRGGAHERACERRKDPF